MKKSYITAAYVLFACCAVMAQETASESDSIKLINLKEVVFSANKSEEQKAKVPYAIEIIKSKDVEFGNTQSTPDMLQNTGAVMVQKSQAGGGSPILRGFEASRVLLVVDGVRMNNAIYRAGHLQDAMTIDNNMLERTEVIFGPSSVMYGSDALGGVVSFITKKPVLGTEGKAKFGLNAATRYSSANMEKTAHVDFNLGFQKVGFLTSVTMSDFGDVRTGEARNPNASFGYRPYYVERFNGRDSMVKNSDPYVQKFTAYKQTDFMQKVLFKVNDNVETGINFQYSTSSNIPRYDRLTEMSGANLKYAEWAYGPQNRMLSSIYANVKSEGKFFNNMRIIGAYQDIDQERINRRFQNKNRTVQHEDVQVISVNADLMKVINEKNDLHYGLEWTSNAVASTANVTDIVANTVKPASTRYADGGATMSGFAAYLTHSWKISEKAILSDGLRFSHTGLEATFKDTTFFPFPYKSATQSSSALNGNIGIILIPEDNVRFTILASTGYRAPNVDDLTKLFDSAPGMLVVPNPDIKPEYAYNIEAGFANMFGDGKWRLEGTYFYTLLTNAMVMKDFKLNGSDSVIYAGTKSKVVAMQNADEAYIQGVTGTLTADLNQNFSFKSSITYTKGSYKDNKNDTIIPLDHIAPVYGRTSVIHRCKKMESEFSIAYNGEKKLVDYSPSGEDNLQYATATGMPKWMTFNFRTSFQVYKGIRLNLGVENLFNTHYRVFASGISAPGRNIFVTLRAKF